MSNLKKSNILAVKFILIFFVFLKASPAFSQTYGCTDSSANNYDPSATINDGSCNYDVTSYAPPVIVDPISDTLKESSGLQWAGNSLWSFNDRGGTPDLYRIDTASKAILQVVSLEGASNVDWEELSFDGTYFYVGDFGNNLDGARTDLKIYKFPYNAIPDYVANSKTIIPSNQIKVINFKYSDQPQPPVAVELDATKFDCEAMVVTDGKIHLFTKDWIDYTSTHYVINSTLPGSYVATPVDTLNTKYLVTGASKSPGRDMIALLGYVVGGPRFHYMHLLSAYSGGKFFNGNKRLINLPTALETVKGMGQAEGITFRNENYGYISNERIETSYNGSDIIVNQKLRSFDISNFTPSIVLAIELKDFGVNKIDGEDKITWHFSSPVHNVNIEHSSDGLHFTVLKNYSVSTQGSFSNKPSANLNYYRIAWKGNNNVFQYSKIIVVQNKENNLISNVLLKTNGELSFLMGESREESFSFKLLTIDGKELSRVATRSYKPGLNKINFTGCPALSNIVLLTAFNNTQKMTIPVHVIK